MGEFAAKSFVPCQQNGGLLLEQLNTEKWRDKLMKKMKKEEEWQCHAVTRKRSQPLVKNQAAVKPATYTSRISTDIPLYESPGATFDQYLEDKPRVFKAIFPDKQRSQQLNEEKWRIQMLPIEFLFLTVWPVVDMRLRCKRGGTDYPPEVPMDITKVLELDITRWELRGLDNILDPSHFSLGVKGTLYSDKQGTRSRLKGQLQMNISFVLPPMLVLVPEDVRRSVAESVLTRLVENMKHKVNDSLLADYSKFKRERPKHFGLSQ
ncbi:hypothetical protein JRO89_XS12G0234200 [Xanthoceras sorbifolium]|uniref:Uncharacterized protein n=1 Tax=Xanthoceras sorbifolium TaxID=99658 RepID=A0ABQ8HDH5_9ROSI|nr:hypothetical protein JRO89_XS12G0234200 [Xanthoceras sorbifolium]